MGVLSRMFRLCKADVHGIMDQMEDKSLLLKQCLREMESSLKAKDVSLAQIDQSHRHLQRELSQRQEEIQKLETDLGLALRKEKDDIARMLIRKRRSLESACDHLDNRIGHLAEERQHLSDTIERQRLQYDQLKVKVISFCQLAENRTSEETAENLHSMDNWATPSQEEIELELLQRKEALEQGGAL